MCANLLINFQYTFNSIFQYINLRNAKRNSVQNLH